jgi:DNA-binding GntR family transcriptional regulator
MANVSGESSGLHGLHLELDEVRLVDRVYEQIKGAIQDGRIKPGQRLVQDALARQLGISRSPVREAIVRLGQEGFIHLEPHRGAVVRPVTDREMDQIYQVRQLLEPFAAAEAATHATDEEIERLAAVQREAVSQREALNPADVFWVNGEFHRVLVAPCHNEVLVGLLASLWERQVTFNAFAVYSEQRGATEHMLHEHQAILEAFTSRRSEQVRTLVEYHIRDARIATERANAQREWAHAGDPTSGSALASD